MAAACRGWLALLLACTMMLGAAQARALRSQVEDADSSSQDDLFGIVCAYYKEFNALYPLMNNTRNETAGGRLFVLGTIGTVPVVLVTSGEGSVNSAMTTQSLIDRYAPGHIMFAGVATGIGGAARRCDVAIPTKWANIAHQRMLDVLRNSGGEPSSDFAVLSYDVDRPDKFVRGPDNVTVASITVPVKGSFPPPEEEAVKNITQPGGKVLSHFAVPMYSELLSSPDGQDAFLNSGTPQELWFEADPYLLDIAAGMVEAENITFKSECFNSFTKKVTQLDYTPTVEILPHGGVSIDQYIANVDYAKDIHAIFGAEVFDMETAAFMHVCASNQAPCFAIRSLPNDITDLASADCASNAFPNLQATVSLFFESYSAAR